MSVRIVLDNHGSAFTCLDYVTGKVVLNISDFETISTITVKMEGIARTRLTAPRIDEHGERELKRVEVEIHRVLYLTDTVFPSRELRQQTSSTYSGFTLPKGQYEYPFQLRIPINTSCENYNTQGLFSKISFEKGGIDFARDAHTHAKGTLPPSLSGMPEDEAWVRYFLKATVNRPKFYKTNLRTFDPFVFLPIEPPRPPPTNNEAFAKRQHQFLYYQPTVRKRGLLDAFRHSPPRNPQAPQVRLSIEARLPSPSILVPNEQIPLKIILVKLENYAGAVVIQNVQIRLFAYTRVKAHSLRKDECSIINVFFNHMRLPLGDETTQVGTTVVADPMLLRGAMLPDTVPPSFRTCSIERWYQLEVVLGLSHGLQGPTDMVPLVLPVQVYSGIKPPAKLLEAARNPVPLLPPRSPSTNPCVHSPLYNMAPPAANLPVPPLTPPISALTPKPSPATYPNTLNYPAPWPSEMERRKSVEEEDEAPPPTYEDAIAGDIGPVDGPRRRYQQEGAYFGELPEDVRVHLRTL